MTKNHYLAVLAFIIGYVVNAQSLDSIYYYYKEQKINEGESVTGFYGSNVSNNYILDINQNAINLDISSFPQGLYAIALIVNGQIQDTTNLIKE